MAKIKEEIKYLDNLGNEINIDDYCFCLDGKYASTVQEIRKFGLRKNEFGIPRKIVYFKAGGILSDYKIISLNSLGLYKEDIDFKNIGKKNRDGLGHIVDIGDIVLYLHRQETFTEIGRITKLYPKTVELFIEENYYRDSSLTKYYNEIIDLSKIGLGNLILKDDRDMMIIDL
ncbi:hypothetical protein J6Y73_04070 [bacterium]|nr:hypothetical protein [bacterium]